jgi:hypothetical protein
VALAEAVDLARVSVCVECHMCTSLVQWRLCHARYIASTMPAMIY